MLDHFATKAKAYAALVGSVATALLGIYSTGDLGHVLTVVVAVATAVTTYAVPNAEAGDTGEDGGADTGLLLLVPTFVGVVLLLFGVRFR